MFLVTLFLVGDKDEGEVGLSLHAWMGLQVVQVSKLVWTWTNSQLDSKDWRASHKPPFGLLARLDILSLAPLDRFHCTHSTCFQRSYARKWQLVACWEYHRFYKHVSPATLSHPLHYTYSSTFEICSPCVGSTSLQG